MRKVTSCKVLEGFCLELTFDDGVHGIVDLHRRELLINWEKAKDQQELQKIAPLE